MLYDEFLAGTEKPDNAWTFAEYKRIEKIYNNDNRLEKSDAYKMYREPDELTRSLIEAAEDYKAQMIKAKSEIKALWEEIDQRDQEIKFYKDQLTEIRSLAAQIKYEAERD